MQPDERLRPTATPDFPADLFSDHAKEKRPTRVTISHDSEAIFRFLSDPDHYRRFLDEVGVVQIEKADCGLIVWRAGEQGFGAFLIQKAAAGRGTIVTCKMEMSGEWNGIIARLIGRDSDTRAAVALRRIKAYLETGEIPTVDGQPSGREEKQTHH